MIEDHPDPTGPEDPEEPTAAHDGAETGNGGRNISDHASEEEIEQEEPPIRGDGQLSLGGLGLRRSTGVESAISLMSARRKLEGRLDPETDHLLVVKVRAHGHDATYQRTDADSPRIDSATVALKFRPLSVRRVPPELEAVVQNLALVADEDVEGLAERLRGIVEDYLPEDLREFATA